MREDVKALRRQGRDGQAILRRRGGRHQNRRKLADKQACRGKVAW